MPDVFITVIELVVTFLSENLLPFVKKKTKLLIVGHLAEFQPRMFAQLNLFCKKGWV